MKSIIEIIEQPWPWYVSGPLLGLIVPLLLVLSNKQFGISSSFRHLCAATGVKSIEYFNYNWRQKGTWQLLFVLGVLIAGGVIGGFVHLQSGSLSESAIRLFSEKGIEVKGLFPVATFSFSGVFWWVLILGGLLIGFGSRYAGGCTGGHAITGLSTLSLASLLAVLGFFIGGIISTYILIKFIV